VRFVLLFTLFALSTTCFCFAGEYQLDGEPFNPPATAQICWGFAVTNLPIDLWVYRVYPQSFSTQVISNLLRIGNLQFLNRQENDRYMKAFDKDYMRFMTQNSRGRILRCLNVSPSRGWIEYFDHSGDPKTPLEEGPSEKETFQLAVNLMFQAGIDRSEVDPQPRAGSYTTSQRGDGPPFITERGVIYQRLIDGVDERGSCFMADFGSHGKVSSYQIQWRNLVPYEPCSIVDTNEIIDLIRSGKAKLSTPEEVGIVNQITRLKIVKCVPLFYSLPSNSKQQLDFEFPYADITVEADYGSTNALLYLNCPLIKN
jgi:hypothetical protein